jgi:hypothetical protein
MFTKTISYPQVKVLPYLTVPVKRVTYTCRIGRITLSAACQQPPVLPDAFKDDSSSRTQSAPAALRINKRD